MINGKLSICQEMYLKNVTTYAQSLLNLDVFPPFFSLPHSS